MTAPRKNNKCSEKRIGSEAKWIMPRVDRRISFQGQWSDRERTATCQVLACYCSWRGAHPSALLVDREIRTDTDVVPEIGKWSSASEQYLFS